MGLGVDNPPALSSILPFYPFTTVPPPAAACHLPSHRERPLANSWDKTALVLVPRGPGDAAALSRLLAYMRDDPLPGQPEPAPLMVRGCAVSVVKVHGSNIPLHIRRSAAWQVVGGW
jgi:hypothetical protein